MARLRHQQRQGDICFGQVVSAEWRAGGGSSHRRQRGRGSAWRYDSRPRPVTGHRSTAAGARAGTGRRSARNSGPRVRPANRLGAGASLPPLLLDDEEAGAVAVGLRTAAGVSGIEETSLRALGKLEQVLPSRLRQRVNMLQSVTTSIASSGPTVEADVLTAIAGAIRAHEQLRFDYVSFEGIPSRRMVEPHRLVHARSRWFLVAWDVERADGARSEPIGSDRVAPMVRALRLVRIRMAT